MAYESLRFVDMVGSNYLFRGGSTLGTDGNFDYQGLVNAIRQPLSPPPVPVPENFFLVVVNLLHTNEVQPIEAELNYFQTNPGNGQVNFWDTNGTARCYFETDAKERHLLVETLEEWLPDPLIWRVATLRRWLENPALDRPGNPWPATGPIVIYVHCDGGCDRTGEMIGAYTLRYLDHDWCRAYAANEPCGRPLGCNNYRALQWYAHWLNTQDLDFQVTGIGNDDGCYDGPSKGIWKPCSPAPCRN